MDVREFKIQFGQDTLWRDLWRTGETEKLADIAASTSDKTFIDVAEKLKEGELSETIRAIASTAKDALEGFDEFGISAACSRIASSVKNPASILSKTTTIYKLPYLWSILDPSPYGDQEAFRRNLSLIVEYSEE